MVKEVNEGNFEAEVLDTTGDIVVDMYADWCGPPALRRSAETTGAV